MELATRARLNELRQRHLSGVQLSIEELQEAIRIMREDRVGAQAASTTSKTRAAGKKKLEAGQVGDLLAGLFGSGSTAEAPAAAPKVEQALPAGFRKL